MDQSYLRFASEAKDKREVFQHCFYGLLCYGALLGALIYLFARPLAELAGIGAENAHLMQPGRIYFYFWTCST